MSKLWEVINMKKLIPILLFMILLASGCKNTGTNDQTKNNDLSKATNEVGMTAEMASKYLEDKGYTIISNDGKVGEDYILTKELLTQNFYEQDWSVQNVKASDYFNKTIQTYKFIVKNHPLDNYKCNINKQTRIWVMVCENKIIGGYSLPDLDLIGGVYPLDGISD